jgi:hypothetical protein
LSDSELKSCKTKPIAVANHRKLCVSLLQGDVIFLRPTPWQRCPV